MKHSKLKASTIKSPLRLALMVLLSAPLVLNQWHWSDYIWAFLNAPGTIVTLDLKLSLSINLKYVTSWALSLPISMKKVNVIKLRNLPRTGGSKVTMYIITLCMRGALFIKQIQNFYPVQFDTSNHFFDKVILKCLLYANLGPLEYIVTVFAIHTFRSWGLGLFIVQCVSPWCVASLGKRRHSRIHTFTI